MSVPPGVTLPMLPLVRLLQLASPALPIGSFSYSQGLEWAIEARWVVDEPSARSWIGDALELAMVTCEAAVYARAMRAWAAGDEAAIASWNGWFRASRETAELAAETAQMGHALRKILTDLGVATSADCAVLDRCAPATLPVVHALAAHRLDIPIDAALAAYVFGWAENQVMAAVKAVPLGQAAGQRMLAAIGSRVPGAVARALEVGDDALVNFAPGLAIASARHEVQYTRLFRS